MPIQRLFVSAFAAPGMAVFALALLIAAPAGAIDLGNGATAPNPGTARPADPPRQPTGTIRPPIDNGRPPAGNPPPGCSRASWLAGNCNAYPYPDAQRPGYDDRRGPYGDRRGPRPVVIVPTAAPADDTPLTDDWEGCRKAKLGQMNSARSGDTTRARQMEEWLWKNCRAYSDDLRQLEQDSM